VGVHDAAVRDGGHVGRALLAVHEHSPANAVVVSVVEAVTTQPRRGLGQAPKSQAADIEGFCRGPQEGFGGLRETTVGDGRIVL